MRRNKQAFTFNLEDYKLLDQLNYDRTVMFAEHVNNAKRYVMKCIDLGANVILQRENDKVNRLLLNTHPHVLKPQLYCIRQDDKNGHKLYLLSPRMPISLQKILTIYRAKSCFLSRKFVESFLQVMYNTAWKLNEQSFFHGNLKPSNIFYKDGGWQIGECGLPSARINKYYAKGFEGIFDKNKSVQYSLASEQYGLERDLYALGIMAIQMMSMQRINNIFELIINKEEKSRLKSTLEDCSKKYGVETVEFARCLVENPSNSKQVYKRFKNSQSVTSGDQTDEQISIHSFMSNNDLKVESEYNLNLPELDEIYERIRATKDDCAKTLQNFHAVDEYLEFQLANLVHLNNVLEHSYGYEISFDKTVEIWEYFTMISQMRYINILREIYPIEEVIKAIVCKVGKNYATPREFFEKYNKGAEFWNAAAFKNLLDFGEIDITNEQLRIVIRLWNKDEKREYLTFKEFCKVFGVGLQNTSLVDSKHDLDNRRSSVMDRSQTVISTSYESELIEMLTLLRERVPNKSLFRFFRDHDPKMRWVVDYTIDRIIHDKIRMPQDKLKKAIEQMWSGRAGIPGQRNTDRKIKYLVLLADSKLEKAPDLFKMVLIEKINLFDFDHYFGKYKLDKEGWTIESLTQINKDEMLEFHDRDLIQFFKALDKDGSQTISEKELKQKLTGLKEFSESVYVENLRQFAASSNIPIINLFFNQDRNKDLQFDSLDELQAVFSASKIPISKQHVQQLYYKYCKRDKFEYVDFLKQIYKDNMDLLFKYTLTFVMDSQYDGNFERVYKMGLIGKSTKWTAKSLGSVNDEMVLGFTQNELEQVWQKFDPNDDKSLSKTEVAKVLDTKYQKQTYEYEQEEQPPKQLARGLSKKTDLSRKESKPTQKSDKQKKLQNRVSIKQPEKQLTLKQKLLQEVENNDILRELMSKGRKRNLIEIFFENDTEDRFSLSYREFQNSLKSIGIEVKKGAVNMYTKDFQFENSEREVRINFIKILLFLNSLEDDQAEAKSATILTLLRKFMKVRKCTVDDLLASGRNKNKWTISSLESFLSKSLDSQIFYDDIEIVWEYWNCGIELDRNQLIEILEKGTVTGKSVASKRKNEQKEQYGERDKKLDRDHKSKQRSQHNDEKQRHQHYDEKEAILKKQSMRSLQPQVKNKQKEPVLKKRNTEVPKATKEEETWTLTAPTGAPKQNHLQQQVQEESYEQQSDEQASPKPSFKREKSSGLRGKAIKDTSSQEEKTPHSPKRRREEESPRYSPKRRNEGESPREERSRYDNKRSTLQESNKRDRSPKFNRDSPSHRRQSDDLGRNFTIKMSQDISFMKNPDDSHNRRRDIDEDQVKYTTDKSDDNRWPRKDYTEENKRQNEKERQRSDKDRQRVDRRTSIKKIDKTKQKEAKLELVKNLTNLGLKEIEKLCTKDRIDEDDLKQILTSKYRLRRQHADIVVTNMSKNGRVNLSELRELVTPSQSSNQQAFPSLSPRVYSSFKQRQSNNNLSSSQHIPTQKRPKLNGALIREHIKILINQFSKKTSVSDLPYFFFGKGDLIDLERFVQKCEQINKNISRTMIEQIFNYMSPLKGEVSLLNFKTAFHQTMEMGNEQLEFPPQLEKELKQVFTKADKDKSQSISKQELPLLLTVFGVNMTTKEIESYLKVIDINNNNTVDFVEFKQFIARNIFPVISNFEEVIDILRKELRNADLFSCGSLEAQQLKAALVKLGVTLTEEELIQLMIELGKDGRINIEDLIYQVANVANCKLRNIVRMTLFKIRFLKRITIKDIKNTFSKLSSCFSIANSFQAMRTLTLLPSTSLRPRVDPSGLFYHDYFYTNINSIDPTKPSLQRVAKYNQLVIEIRFDEATGIPIPLETLITRNNILRRSVNISFLDNSQEKIRDSMCEIEAEWDPDLEDVWKFTNNKGFDRGVYVKIGDYDDSKFMSYSVLFEFVMTVLDGTSVIDINCGSANLVLNDISRINSAVDRKLEVTGGIPTKKRFLKKQDVLARRTGWRKILTGQAESALNIEIVPHTKFRDKLPILDIMPMRIIMNKSCLGLYRYFREYFAEKSVNKGRINLTYCNDYKIKSFLAAIDCRQIYEQLIPFWNSNIESKIKGMVEGKTTFELLCKQLFMMISNREFGYLPSCPTYDCSSNKTLESARNKLIKEGLDNVLNTFRKLPIKKRQIDPANINPFVVADNQSNIEDNILLKLRKGAK